MTAIRIDGLTFDHASYDAQGDVLYLHVGQPQPAAESEETVEGHVLRYDDHGRIIGVTIVNARWYLERDGAITVTLPHPQWRASAGDLAPIVGLAG